MIWQTKRMEYFAVDVCRAMSSAMPDKWEMLCGDKNCAALISKEPPVGKFAVIVSSGAGNGPLVHGFVGAGLADAAVIGAPFAAPNAYAIYETACHYAKDKGILLLCNNFSGDYLNNGMAAELLEVDGAEVEVVFCTDDIASAIGEPRSERNAFCGIAQLTKLAACCAKAGMTLSQAAELLREANDRMGTLSVHVDFALGKIAYGAGFSGEPGILSENHMDMELCAKQACDMLLCDLCPTPEERLIVLVNRLRLTSHADGYIIAGLVNNCLSRYHKVEKLRVGTYSSVMDVYGFSVSILCANENIRKLLEADCFAESFVL